MASVLQIAAPDVVRRIQKVQAITIAWMSVEAVVSLFSAWQAHSSALLAFGADSAVELISALVVLCRRDPKKRCCKQAFTRFDSWPLSVTGILQQQPAPPLRVTLVSPVNPDR